MAVVMETMDGDEHSGPSERLQSIGRRWQVRALVLVGLAPGNLAVVIPRPHLAAIEADIGQGPGGDLLVKMILTIVGLSIVITSPLVAFGIRGFGHRAVLGGGLLLVVLAGCAPFLLTSMEAVVASRLVLGVAMAAVQVGTTALIGDIYKPADRPRMYGMMMAGSTACTVVLGPLSGFAGEWGWHYAFLLYAVLAPFAVFAWVGLPARIDHKVEQVAASQPRERLSVPYALIVIALLAGVGLTLPTVFLPFKFKDISILSPSVIGASFLAISLPEVAASALYGRIRKRVPAERLLLVGLATNGSGLMLVAMAGTLPLMLVGMALMGASIAFIFASLAERAAANAKQRSRNAGLFFTCIYVSAIGGTFAFQPVFEAFRSSGTLLAIAIVMGIAILTELWLRNHKGPAERSDSRVAAEARP